jgi:hypothetical protein
MFLSSISTSTAYADDVDDEFSDLDSIFPKIFESIE